MRYLPHGAWCVAVLLNAAVGGAYAARTPVGEVPGAHEFHVTYGRMAVENNQAMLQIRLFKDDLERVLRQRFAEPGFVLGATPHADSLFTRYLNEVFILKQGGRQVPGAIVSSGEEAMGQEAMWWYLVRFEAPGELRAFTVRNVVLFDLFGDQKNIFKVKHFPSEKERSFYFAEGAEEYDVSFDR